MTTLRIIRKDRDIGLAEAVEMANADVHAEGVIERLRDVIDNQNKMIARMLMVQFGQYGDEFTPGYEPATDADRLAFIIDATVLEGE